MKTNAKGSECDWLLNLSCRNNDGSYDLRFINYWNKTREEIMTIAGSYCSSNTFVYIYKLEDMLFF